VMRGLHADEMTARLLAAAPHLINPDWLEADRDAVPFITAGGAGPVVAGRLAAAVRSRGERHVLICPAARSRPEELAAEVEADGPRIHSALQALGTAETLVSLPDLSAALLGTAAGFAVAAGPRQFVEAVIGLDVRRARARFADFALAAPARPSPQLEAAAYYGCALSGRGWRPAWLAWHWAADVPQDSGIGAQLAAMRAMADGRIGAEEFERTFRAGRRNEIAAGERAAGPLAEAVNAVCWALDAHAASGVPGGPGGPDPAKLRAAVSAALTDI
jgi:hypothetical protein